MWIRPLFGARPGSLQFLGANSANAVPATGTGRTSGPCQKFGHSLRFCLADDLLQGVAKPLLANRCHSSHYLRGADCPQKVFAHPAQRFRVEATPAHSGQGMSERETLKLSLQSSQHGGFRFILTCKTFTYLIQGILL